MTLWRLGGMKFMSKFFKCLCAWLWAYSASPLLHADAPIETMPAFPIIEDIQAPSEEAVPIMTAPVINEPFITSPPLNAAPIASESKPAMKKIAESRPEVSVDPFTGKIKGRKVRMRLQPDLDSKIVKELSKNEMIIIVGEQGDFWAIEAPEETKGYVFRSFILDNVVEGNRVNVRLEPSLDAPIIAHLNSGDKIQNAAISPINPKWLEIAPPKSTHFYIAKEYVEYAGGPEVKAQLDRRRSAAEKLLDTTNMISKAQMRKPFEEIDFDQIVKGYNTVIADFNEFSELVEQSKEALAVFQEEYLQKRISHLESQSSDRYAASDGKKSTSKESFEAKEFATISMITDKMKLWAPIEDALYSIWSNVNDNKSQRDYYEEQRLAAVEISGIVEPYTSPVKNKPGDFILRDKDVPVGYIYSMQINLQNLVGKQVRLVAAPRPNNNFAFPAYYVLSVE
jgi:hypothetical protein